MTPEQQRIAIAEECGYTWFQSSGNNQQKVLARSSEEAGTVGLGKWIWSLTPDYPNDLNAMHEAEKSLTLLQIIPYLDNLSRLVNPKNGQTAVNWVRTHATATQRAEAFLHTIGKWSVFLPSTVPASQPGESLAQAQ